MSFRGPSHLASVSGFNPVLRPKVSLRVLYGLIPLFSCISPVTIPKTPYLSILFIFFSFSSNVIFFGYFFGRFWPPLGVLSPHMDLNPEFSYLNRGSDRNWTLIIDSVQIIWFFSLFLSICCLWGAFLGHYRTPSVAYGMPKVTTWSLVPIYTITDVQQPKKSPYLMTIHSMAFWVG